MVAVESSGSDTPGHIEGPMIVPEVQVVVLDTSEKH